MPLLKWVGGKAGSVDDFRSLLPSTSRISGYRDVCFGGGAVYFMLYGGMRAGGGVVLSDANAELMEMYQVVRDDGVALIRRLDTLRDRFMKATTWEAYDATYFELRSSKPRDRVGRAARMITLNKTCHNGLYRTNKDGEFNVGPGHRGSTQRKPGPVVVPAFYDAKNIERVAAALQGVPVLVCDAEKAINAAKDGEFVYVDPPYWPAQKGGFTSYTADGFSDQDQRRIADAALRAAARGAHVAISNHDLPATRSLYSRFNIVPLAVHHPMSASAKTRGAVHELLACTFEPGALSR